LVDVGVEAALRQHHKLGKWLPSTVTKAIRAAVTEALKDGLTLTNEDDTWTGEAEACREVALRALTDLDLDRFETVEDSDGKPLIQYKMRSPLGVDEPWSGFVGILDWVARDKETGRVFLVDLKVSATSKDSVTHTLGAQWAIYQRMLYTELGIEVDGSVEWWVRGVTPGKPKVNKNGNVSRQAVVTTWAIYLETVKQNKGKPADYLDMKEKLEATPWSRWEPFYRSMSTCEAIWDRVVFTTAKEIKTVLGTNRPNYTLDAVPRNLSGMSCQWCDFRGLCHGQMAGDDVSWLIEEGYEHGNQEGK